MEGTASTLTLHGHGTDMYTETLPFIRPFPVPSLPCGVAAMVAGKGLCTAGSREGPALGL